MSSLLGFDFDEFLKNDESNRKGSRQNLEKYWGHFQIVASFYSDLYQGVDKSLIKESSERARFYFLAGCYVNLVKAISSITAGHLSDSNIFARRTLESIRYSVFIRDNPQWAELWFETTKPEKFKDFESKFKKWFYKDGNQAVVESELKLIPGAYKLASNWGPHANFPLFTFQNAVEKKDDEITFRLFFHELPPGDEGFFLLLQQYFWHLAIAFDVADWWLSCSGLKFNMKQGQVSFWREQYALFHKAGMDLAPHIRKGLFGNDGPNDNLCMF